MPASNVSRPSFRVGYDAIPGLLTRCQPFTGSSISAVGDPDSEGGYNVLSYWLRIAQVRRDPVSGRLVRWVDPDYYSATTSRGQRLARRHLPGLDSVYAT